MKIPSLVRLAQWWTVSCGVVALAAAQPMPVYFGTGGGRAKGIYRATFDPKTGKLTPAELAAEVGNPGFLALHPDGTKLYAVAGVAGMPSAVGYRIGATGALEIINSAPTTDGGGAHIAVHPSGKFLLTAQYGGGSTALFPLDAQGRLGTAQVVKHGTKGSGVMPSRQEKPHAHMCAFSPDSRFALVPDLGMDAIVVHRIDLAAPSITMHGVIASVPGGGARHMKFSPDGKFIYLLNELSLSVTSFAWDAAAGTANLIATVPALSEAVKAKEAFNSAAEILVHASGKFLYSSNRGHDTITVYRADPATAVLQVIQVQPVRGAFPRNIALSPDGGWLLAAGADSNTVAVHRVNQTTGELTYQTKGVINVPAPICIVFLQR